MLDFPVIVGVRPIVHSEDLAPGADEEVCGEPTTARWLSYGHVVMRIGNESANVISDELARRGLSRRVGVEVPSFLAGLLVVAGSDLLMNAPLPLVHEVAETLGIVVRAAPIPLPRVPFALLWHERFQADPAHRWARDRVFAAVRPRLARSGPLNPRR